jgi:hypothetical protein
VAPFGAGWFRALLVRDSSASGVVLLASDSISPDARFGALISVSLFILSTMIALLTYVIRAAMRIAKTEERVTDMMSDIQKIVESKEKDHRQLADALKSVYESTDRRLRWLEENTWKRGSRRDG